MKTIYKFLPLLVLAPLLMQCCKEDDKDCYDPTNPKCVNYDPCYNAKLPDANFTIQESIYTTYPGTTGWHWMPDDSVFLGTSDIKFDSPFNGAEYEHTWYLGAEIINGNTFTRDHSSVGESSRPYQITVSHVLEYTIDTECFPNTKGRDSIARTYTLIRNFSEFESYGNYRGVFENKTDSFDFSFYYLNSQGIPAEVYQLQDLKIGIYNFHNLGDSTRMFFSPRNRMITVVNPAGTHGLLTLAPGSEEFIFEYLYQGQKQIIKGRKLE